MKSRINIVLLVMTLLIAREVSAQSRGDTLEGVKETQEPQAVASVNAAATQQGTVTQQSTPQATGTNQTRTVHYEGAALLLDLIGVGLSATGIGIIPGYLVIIAGSPVNHFRHQETAKGMISLSLRLGFASTALSGLASGLSFGRSDSGAGTRFAIGVTGLAVTMIVDDVLLSHKTETVPSAAAKPTVSFAPRYEPLTGETGFNVYGTF